MSATAPNELFSWDLTYLPAPVTGRYFYLYLFLDIFSRKVVGWQVYETESSALASQVMRDICLCERIVPGQVVLLSYNKARLHSTLAYVSPMQFESEWLAKQANS